MKVLIHYQFELRVLNLLKILNILSFTSIWSLFLIVFNSFDFIFLNLLVFILYLELHFFEICHSFNKPNFFVLLTLIVWDPKLVNGLKYHARNAIELFPYELWFLKGPWVVHIPNRIEWGNLKTRFPLHFFEDWSFNIFLFC